MNIFIGRTVVILIAIVSFCYSGSDASDRSDDVVSYEAINVQKLVTGAQFDNILKPLNPVINRVNHRLYVTGARSTSVAVVDLDRDELVMTFDIGVRGGFLLIDPRNGDLYMFRIEERRYYRIDEREESAVEVSGLPAHMNMPKKGRSIKYNDLYYSHRPGPFKVGDTQDLEAAYGIIDVKDAGGRSVHTIKHGPDALYFTIDQDTGKLYATNTGDGSITVFDLNRGAKQTKKIRIGSAINQVELSNDSSVLYIRNRLGGSVIYIYDLRSKLLRAVPRAEEAGPDGVGLWPSKMIIDGGLIYALCHYAPRIDVIDTALNRVINSIPIRLSLKPRTDGVSTMVYNRRGKKLYAAFPELGELAVVDTGSGRFINTIRIKEAGSYTGPGQIVLAFDEKLNRLFLHITKKGTLLVYDGSSLEIVAESHVSGGKGEMNLRSNSEKRELYLGEKIIDAQTLRIKGRFPTGSKVVGFDNDKERVYLSKLTPIKKGVFEERLMEYKLGVLQREWVLPDGGVIPSKYTFDFKAGKFYRASLETATINIIDLENGRSIAASGGERERVENLDSQGSYRGRMEQPRGGGGNGPRREYGGGSPGRSKCGDGVCGPVESNTGHCPQDCL